MAIRTGTGGKGKTFNDRELAAKVRSLAMDETYRALQGKGLGEDIEFKKALLLKLASNLLPRLNAGRSDDEPLFPEPIYGRRSLHTNNSDGKTIQLEEETS